MKESAIKNLEKSSWKAGIVSAVLAVVSLVWAVYSYFKPPEAAPMPVSQAAPLTSPVSAVINGNQNVVIQHSDVKINEIRDEPTRTTLMNERFGFKSTFPADWTRQDPENDDGFKFVDKTGRARILAYAGWVVDDVPKDKMLGMHGVTEFVAAKSIEHAKQDGAADVQEIRAGFIAEVTEAPEKRNVALPGARIEYDVRIRGEQYHRVISVSAFSEGGTPVQFHVYCELPIPVTREYDKACRRTIADFRVLAPWKR
jgi:hypothetical protein